MTLSRAIASLHRPATLKRTAKMKILLFVFVLIQYYENVESLQNFDSVFTVMGDFARVIKNKFEAAGIGFKSMLKHMFKDKIYEREIIVVTTQTSSPDISRPHDYLKTFFVTLAPKLRNYKPTDALIRDHGKRCTTHTLHTKDGYELILHRLINPIGLRGMKQTILLHHGLLGSSADWILLGPEKSLPYYLATLGYDVWFANARGNRYSRGHRSISPDSTKYWDFSWQEIGLYDLPAIIDYVRHQTNEPLNFIGHSLGATALLVLLSSVPKYNEFLRMAILLGPLVYMKNIKGPLRMISLMTDPPPEDLFEILGNNDFVPSRKLPDDFLKRYCLDEVLLCGNPLFFVTGVPRNNTHWTKDFTKLLFQNIPAGGSTKTFLHYAQLVKSGKFHKFGEVNNEFSLKEVTTPVALISSNDDWLASIPDLVRLYINIFNPIEHYIIRDRNVSHTDFVWGPDANKLVFPKVIELLQSKAQVVGKQENDV